MRILLYLLMFFMLSQSVLAAKDVHKSHQSGNEHVVFDDHQHDDIGIDTPVQSQSENWDCHHCCHCQDKAGVAILLVVKDFPLPVFFSGFRSYFFEGVVSMDESQYRPPII